ncbi:MAG: metallophosphoesterase [Anaerolineales bacterium]|nr:metallophosphoesterase [Anaerolineales bacterium]
MITLGVVADTHVPDRLPALPPALFEALAGVDAILHAGDVCVPGVLRELERVAPVHAVAGNRDWFLRLPLDRVLAFEGVRLGLTHGHGGLWGYAREKLRYYTVGYYHQRFLRQVWARFLGVQAIVFGHSHWPVNFRQNGVLLFNPGSFGPDYRAPHGAAIGRLIIDGTQIRGEIVPVPVPGGPGVLPPDPRIKDRL